MKPEARLGRHPHQLRKQKKPGDRVTLAIQRFCAIIAYYEDVAGTTWTERGRGGTSPVNKRIYDEAPVRELHMCKIGDWVRNTQGRWIRSRNSSARSKSTTHTVRVIRGVGIQGTAQKYIFENIQEDSGVGSFPETIYKEF